MNIVLIGLKSCGKTSVGKILASKLSKDFIDTDQLLIERHAVLTQKKQSIREIYQHYGEFYFRDLENKVIATLSHVDDSVVATGGGSVMDAENVKILKKNGHFIYLDLSLESWNERIHQQSLPTFIESDHPSKNLADLYARRNPIYQKSADLLIKIDGQSIAAIIKTIMKTTSSFPYGQ